MLKNIYWKIIHSNFGMFVVFSIKPVIRHLDYSISKIEHSISDLTYFVVEYDYHLDRKDVKFLGLTLSFILLLIPMIISLIIISYLKALKSLFSNKSGVVLTDNTDNNQKSHDDLPF